MRKTRARLTTSLRASLARVLTLHLEIVPEKQGDGAGTARASDESLGFAEIRDLDDGSLRGSVKFG